VGDSKINIKAHHATGCQPTSSQPVNFTITIPKLPPGEDPEDQHHVAGLRLSASGHNTT